MIKLPRQGPTPLLLPTAPRQLSIAFESIWLRGISQSERAKVLTHLASLLILAAGVADKESDDDEH
jgi:hypothetical protein